jgi:RHS repeat-associated protein
VGELRYKAWGESRAADYPDTATPTDLRFTGQRLYEGLGLYHYGARVYDPALGRFLSPDTLVPGQDAAAWDRYAYALENPVKYIDPSGHYVCENENCKGPDRSTQAQIKLINYCYKFDIPCWAKNVEWVKANLSTVKDRLGYDLGELMVPIHTDVNSSTQNKKTEIWTRHLAEPYKKNPNLFFEWEGPGLVLYSEHRDFYGIYLWVDMALGILNTMKVRTENNVKWRYADYRTLNEAARSSYALPQLPESYRGGIKEEIFHEFLGITIGWYYFNVNLDGEWEYDYFSHRNDREGKRTCFGYHAGLKPYCIP